jgi:hypothetical protein
MNTTSLKHLTGSQNNTFRKCNRCERLWVSERGFRKGGRDCKECEQHPGDWYTFDEKTHKYIGPPLPPPYYDFDNVNDMFESFRTSWKISREEKDLNEEAKEIFLEFKLLIPNIISTPNYPPLKNAFFEMLDYVEGKPCKVKKLLKALREAQIDNKPISHT